MAPPVLSLCEKESGRDSVGCFFCDAADDFARFSCCICERRYRSTTGTGLKLPLAAEVTNVRFGPEGAVEAHMAKALKAPTAAVGGPNILRQLTTIHGHRYDLSG